MYFSLLQKGNWIIVLPEAVIQQHTKRVEKERARGVKKLDPARLQWKPPVFTASNRTWNW